LSQEITYAKWKVFVTAGQARKEEMDLDAAVILFWSKKQIRVNLKLQERKKRQQLVAGKDNTGPRIEQTEGSMMNQARCR